MSATDQRKAMGHIKFFIGTTDTFYYQLLSIPKTHGNKHKTLRKTLIHHPFILNVDYSLRLATIIFTGIMFSSSKTKQNKTKNKAKQKTRDSSRFLFLLFLSSLLPMPVRGTRSEGQEREKCLDLCQV